MSIRQVMLFCVLSALSFGQVSWDIDVVDTIVLQRGTGSMAIALDTSEIPHIIYVKRNSLLYATRVADSVWEKEIIDANSSYFCLSLVFDKHNIPHCSYYRLVDQKSYLCHSYRNTAGWHNDIVDSILRALPWSRSGTSIDIDAFNNCGIVYTTWNADDSVFYIKYAYFGDSTWNFSVVEYDSNYAGVNLPPDLSPCLKFSSNNIPYVVYHHLYDQHDTVKLAQWNDSLNKWDLESVMDEPYGCAPVSLALDNEDVPYVAHGVDVALYCSWRVNGVWYHEWAGGIEPGWVGVSLALDVGINNNPFIVCSGPFLYPTYVYKDSIWHQGMIIDSLGSVNGTVLSTNGEPHVCFDWHSYNNQTNIAVIAYARGTYAGVAEDDAGNWSLDAEWAIEVCPNISHGVLNIKYELLHQCNIEFAIHDVSGRKVSSMRHAICFQGEYHKTMDLHALPAGVYFVVIKQNNEKVSKKFLLIK